jgi:pre-mRNA-processing factor 19
VVSRISGHLYEKRLIEKHIESTGTCPITGRPMTNEDLIAVKVSGV